MQNVCMGKMASFFYCFVPVSSVREGQFSLHGGQDIHEVRKTCSYELYNEMGMSESKYYRIKSRAFYKLAFALRIEVYKQ